jgi:hypothetical protein
VGGSTESGEEKVFVAPFAGSGGKWQVSSGGGCVPRWRKDGRELFYLSSDGKITSAEIKATESTLTVIAVKTIFQARLYRAITGQPGRIHFFVVSSNGDAARVLR